MKTVLVAAIAAMKHEMDRAREEQSRCNRVYVDAQSAVNAADALVEQLRCTVREMTDLLAHYEEGQPC